VARAALVSGSLVGAAALPPAVAVLATERWAASGDRLMRLATLGGTALALAVVVVLVLAGTTRFVRRQEPNLPRHEAFKRAAMGWWPALGFAPVVVSIPLANDVAHRFLFEAHDGRIFTLYLAFWIVVAHAVVLGTAALRPALDRAPAVVEVPATVAPAPRRDGFALHGIWLVLAAGVTLTAFLNWGFIQQLTARQGEFESHFVAARVMMRGVLPYQLERDPWAQINVPPPTLVLVYAPWILLPDLPRHVLYGTLHVAAFAAALALLLRTLLSRTMPAVTVALVVVLVGSIYAPWRESFWLGQPNGFIFLALTLGLLAALRRHWVLSGALVAASLIFKPVGGWVLLYLAVARRWRAVLGGIAAGAVLLLVSLPFISPEVWRVWLVEKAPLLLQGTTHHTSISLPVLHARLFLTSNAYYLAVPPPSSPLVTILNVLATLSSLLLLVLLVNPARRAGDRAGQALEFALATVIALMLSPLTWLHYATAALIAFVALVDACCSRSMPAGAKRVAAGLGIVAFGLLSIDQELLLLRTATMWERWTLLGSVSNAGLPILAAAVGFTLWAHDRLPRRSAAEVTYESGIVEAAVVRHPASPPRLAAAT
jgi:hypothetical protein